MIRSRCVACDLLTIAPRPLERMCWRPVVGQWWDCQKSQSVPVSVIIITTHNNLPGLVWQTMWDLKNEELLATDHVRLGQEMPGTVCTSLLLTHCRGQCRYNIILGKFICSLYLESGFTSSRFMFTSLIFFQLSVYIFALPFVFVLSCIMVLILFGLFLTFFYIDNQ